MGVDGINAEVSPKKIGDADTRAGFLFALFAYGIWGFLPLYMKLVAHIPAVEVVAHRILWSIPVAAILLIVLRRSSDLVRAFKSPRILGLMMLSASFISLNWVLYVWAVAVERTTEAALGYYINPLISVVMGAVLLNEKLSRLQWSAVALATFAVAILTVKGGAFPWVALVLAFSFAMYGFLRKTVDIGPTQGFMVEVLLLSPIALGFVIWLSVNGANHFSIESGDIGLLLWAGPVTAIPLILYAFGAKGLRLSTLGLMQYIAPTLIFLVAVFVFKEPVSFWQMVAFALIWIALVLYSWSAWAKK